MDNSKMDATLLAMSLRDFKNLNERRKIKINTTTGRIMREN
jgi:hypothetical protein